MTLNAQLFEGVVTVVTIIPLLDMVNHFHPQNLAEERKFRLEIDSGVAEYDSVGLVLQTKLKKGEEITYTYTMDYDSPLKLLAAYGFTVERNAFADIEIRASIEPSEFYGATAEKLHNLYLVYAGVEKS